MSITRNLSSMWRIWLVVGCSMAWFAPQQADAASGVSPPADWKARWEKTLAGANQEGKLAINIQPGQLIREWVAHFEKRYPKIRLESGSLTGTAFVSRVLPERRAGQYLWDIHLGGPESVNGGLKPVGAVEPLKPALLLPEILDDSKWLGGFDSGFTDKEGLYTLAMTAEVQDVVFVNRDVISEAELSRVEDLIDPKWKGKMSHYDPRTPGKGASDAGHWMMVKGEPWWRQLLAQNSVITRDRRQQIEWVIRGQYPIGISASNSALPDFQSQGLGKSVKALGRGTDMGQRLSMSFVFVIMNRGPNPNTARLFANWALTRESQDVYVKLVEQNSRRLDVTKISDYAPDLKTKYYPSVNLEKNVEPQRRAIAIAKEMLK